MSWESSSQTLDPTQNAPSFIVAIDPIQCSCIHNRDAVPQRRSFEGGSDTSLKVSSWSKPLAPVRIHVILSKPLKTVAKLRRHDTASRLRRLPTNAQILDRIDRRSAYY